LPILQWVTVEKTPPLSPAAWLRFDAVRRALAVVPHRRILEVGAGEGALAWRLAQVSDYVGLEPDVESFNTTSRRLAALGRGRVHCATTRDLRSEHDCLFDLICGFEILEHLEDDEDELLRWHSFLEPRGSILVSVPAHRGRFAAADRTVGHIRRYDRSDLEQLLIRTGYEIITLECWGAGLGHLLEGARNVLAKGTPPLRANAASARSGRWLQPKGRLVGLAASLVAAPFRVLQAPFRKSGFGIGWVALARREEENVL
jgi:SAM-dependent methyltransferase